MAFIVIALGVVMALVGGYLLNYGYAIVQVERGWSSVIAGSVFVAGGLTIASVGVLIRTLGRLGGLAPARSAETAVDPIARHERPEAAPTVVPAALASALPAASEVHPHDHEPAPETPDWHAEPPAAHAFTPEPQPEPEEAPAHEPVPAAEIEPEPKPKPIHHAEREPTAEPEPEPIDAKHEAPAMDDWLDRAFFDLDQNPPPRAAIAPLTLEPERVPQPAHAAHDAEVAPAAVEEPAPTAPAPHDDAPQSAIIGRYESDGTSYVMYADGSIEAQSAAGVYRFSSMAELKSFIEG